MLSKLPQIAKVGIKLASKQANKKAEETDTDSNGAKNRGKAKKARCPVTDADNKHSIDQTPMLGKSLLSFYYLEMEKYFKQVARGTSAFFLNQLSRTTS